MAKAASAKDHAGLGRIHPKDRNDASDRADQQRRRAAQPLVDPRGDQNLVGGSRPRRWALVPAHHLGAIALADALDQGLPFGKLLGRGVGGSTGMGIASLMRTAYRPSNLAPASSAQLRRR